MSILTNIFIESVNLKEVKEQDINTNKSDDKFLIFYNNININIYEPILENRDLPINLPIYPPDVSETLTTPRPIPKHESSSQRPEDNNNIIKIIPYTS